MNLHRMTLSLLLAGLTFGTASADEITASPALGPQQNLGEARALPMHYVTGGFIAPPRTYNQYSPGNTGTTAGSFAGRAAFEIPLHAVPLYIGAQARMYEYQTSVIGTKGIDHDEDVRLGFQVTGPRVYAGVSELEQAQDGPLAAGTPRRRGLGYGIEKLPDLDQNFSINGSFFYYPNIGGDKNGVVQTYRGTRYHVGATLRPSDSTNAFFDLGYLGDTGSVRSGSGYKFKHQGPYAGMGFRF